MKRWAASKRTPNANKGYLMQPLRALSRIIVAVAVGCGAPLGAQWLNHPTPGIPRTADGKPNLAAPAPQTGDRKPDLSGLWTLNPGPYGYNVAVDLKPGDVAPNAQALS